jgi:hypothetical protein
MSEVSETAGLEKQLVDAKFLLERRELAVRLAKNSDFRKLILDGFCLHDAARYVQESGDPALTAEQRADALSIAQASGHLKRFLSITFQMGAHAERTMPELEEALADARAEEMEVI